MPFYGDKINFESSKCFVVYSYRMRWPQKLYEKLKMLTRVLIRLSSHFTLFLRRRWWWWKNINYLTIYCCTTNRRANERNFSMKSFYSKRPSKAISMCNWINSSADCHVITFSLAVRWFMVSWSELEVDWGRNQINQHD